jgi:hypothetical protein
MIYKIETYDNQVYIIESNNDIETMTQTLECTEWHIFFMLEGGRISIRYTDIRRITLLKK